ncbi:MAG: ribosomal protein L7/L12 [Chloroflexi bacterium]|nr:ribosomal protein L7/L12 [Chloroflexota bacterium]
MTEPRKLHVFICHSSQDKPTVRELYKRLQSEPWIDAWLDEEKLLPGQDWEFEIEKALDTSDAVIVSLTKGSVSKEGYIQKELRFVLDIALEKPEGTIFILPVRLEECEPPRKLRTYHYADYFPMDRRDWAYERLLASLQLRADALGIKTSASKVSPAQNTEYVVRLLSIEKAGVSVKINAIKVIREFTKLDLAEAKALSETQNATILVTTDKSLAMKAKKQFEEVGAVAEVAKR